MLLLKSGFKFRDRGFKDTLVLIPGWATDYRIFDGLKLNYNYLIPAGLYHSNFNQALLDQINELKIDKVVVLGFSLGGFLAADFAANFPERVNELILIGVCQGYAPKILGEIKSAIQRNRRAWLYKFYLNCFSRSDLQGLGWFKKNLLKEYTDNLSLDELNLGLDYLASHVLGLERLEKVEKIRIFHGSADRIVPIEEALKIKPGLPQAKFTLFADMGHLLFLHPDFREKFYGK